ncbi:hypothetical protein EBZ37_10790, partial [bacterium]|nr:hypothetical protein [bacterium]
MFRAATGQLWSMSVRYRRAGEESQLALASARTHARRRKIGLRRHRQEWQERRLTFVDATLATAFSGLKQRSSPNTARSQRKEMNSIFSRLLGSSQKTQISV